MSADPAPERIPSSRTLHFTGFLALLAGMLTTYPLRIYSPRLIFVAGTAVSASAILLVWRVGVSQR